MVLSAIMRLANDLTAEDVTYRIDNHLSLLVSIIYNYHLKVLKALIENTIECLPYAILLII